MITQKIKSIKELSQILSAKREESSFRVVHCHGVFDLLHIGHIRYLTQAKSMGHLLIVTVTPDRYVDKGPHRPAFSENLRAESLASLEIVDYVAINEWPTAEETLRLLRPNIYVKGVEFKDTSSDMTGKIAAEEKVIKEIGSKLAFTEDIVFSSSNLINRYLSAYPREVEEYLELFRSRFKMDDVLETLDRMSSLNVLTIGDAIIDEYHYCEAIGKSSKDPVIAVKYLSEDRFAGGILAVANHVANFAGKVTVATVVGDKNSYEEFMLSNLKGNVAPMFMTKPGSPTLVKRRLVDGYSFQKLAEVYIMDDSHLPHELDVGFCDWLVNRLRDYDLVIAADFGHGAISPAARSTLVEHAPYLSVNTQANAGNRGFHSVSRYERADYVCIAEHEIRLEMRDMYGRLRPMMEHIWNRMHCERLVVTRGRQGCLIKGIDTEFLAIPSFTENVVDRIGAGDAFLSVTALGAVLRIPDEILGFIGNVVGALAVRVIGNAKSVDKLSVKKFVTSLLK